MKYTLDEIAAKYGTDKGTIHSHPHGYAKFYDAFFKAWRELPIKLLEIGVAGGESIRMWLDYFPRGWIYGVDIEPDGGINNVRYQFMRGDQGDRDFWNRFAEIYGSDWDIIVDDGGHCSGQIETTFKAMWSHLKPGGFYVIEDMEVAYDPKYLTPGFPDHMQQVMDKLESINLGKDDLEWIHFSKGLLVIAKAGLVITTKPE